VIDETYQRIAGAAYLADVASRSAAELRDRRAECQRVEDRISFVRRLAQGRLDIVRGVRDRRATGSDATDVAALVATLPETLAGGVGGGRRGRVPRVPDLGDAAEAAAELDALCPPADIAHLGQLPPDELDRLEAALADYERQISEQRRVVFDRLDVLANELANRYRAGETSVDSLLG
jgi:hypothetical protein